jgi:hypothetical protein
MRGILSIVTLAAMGLANGRAAASPPSPVTSSVPSCIVACPEGDISDTVVVRGIAGDPKVAAKVVMDFSQCPEVSLCPSQLPPPYLVLSPTQIQVTTGSDGSAIFALQVRGTSAGGVRISADFVLLTDGVSHKTPPLVNADQNGDGAVTSVDQSMFAARTSTDPLGDLNCDGVHNGTDLTIFAAHLGHQCPAIPVPTNSTTWGSLKFHYR